MEDPVSTIIIGVRTSNDTYHREILTVGTSDGVEDDQTTHSKRHDASSDATGPSITVGSVSGVKLVATADEFKTRLSNEVVGEGKVKVTGNGENVADADLD